MTARRVLLALALVSWLPSLAASQAAPPDPARWERDIAAMEAADAVKPPPHGGIMFIGSSSIRLWTTLAADFPGLPVSNRGFGGSQLPDVTAFLDRLVQPYHPRQVVIYCGGNDINAGRSAEQVLADVQALVHAIHAKKRTTKIAYISIAPNPARWAQVATVRKANQLIADWFSTDPRLSFIDVFPHMLGADGQPLPGIFVEDRLHMNASGYAIWTKVVAPYLLENAE